MKTMIDGVIYQLQYARPSGIHRLWTELLRALNPAPDATYTLLSRSGAMPPAFPGQTVQYAPFRWGEPRVSTKASGGADLFVSTYYTLASDAMNVVMVYDLIPEQLGWDLRQTEWAHRVRAMTAGDFYLAISNTTAAHLTHFYGISPDRIKVVTPGVNRKHFHPMGEADKSLARYRLADGKPYLLLVGTPVDYKFPAGFMGDLTRLAKRRGYEIVWPGVTMPRISTPDLCYAYNGARAFITPSLAEGFNLPVVEALACGCEVLAADTAIHREVGGDAALYFNPDDIDSFDEALRWSAINPRVRRDAGRAIADRYTWDKTAEQFQEAMSLCLV